MDEQGIWGPQVIEVIGLTGEYESGKTLFGLMIDPERTLCIDVEKSATAYEASLGFKRIDLVQLTVQEHGDSYTPLDLFLTFWKLLKSVGSEYTVWMIDPVSEIESGLVMYVDAHPEEFGYTSGQFKKMSGLKWGAVKELWKRILTVAAEKCQTLVFTSHLKSEWKGDRPTRNRIPKGKETLMEVASLYLWMERPTDDKGRKRPEPSARVLKSRLATAQRDANGKVVIVPTLPPRLALATPDAIRAYILNPPDYAKLKSGEKASPEEALTDDERLLIQAEMIADQRAIAEAEHGPVSETTEDFLGTPPPKVEAAPVEAAPVENLSPADLEREAATGGNGEVVAGGDNAQAEVWGDRVTPETLACLLKTKGNLGMSDEVWTEVLKRRGVELPVNLTQEQAEELLERMAMMAD